MTSPPLAHTWGSAGQNYPASATGHWLPEVTLVL